PVPTPTPTPTPVPTPTPTPTPVPTPTPAPTPTIIPVPTPTATPPPTSTPAVVPVPTAVFSVDGAHRVYPGLSGVAEPGTTVDVIDVGAAGAPVVARLVCDAASGVFAASEYPGLEFGQHQLAVRETRADGSRSGLTAPTSVALDGLQIVSPNPGATISSSSFVVTAAGDPGGLIAVLIDAPVAAGAASATAKSAPVSAPPAPATVTPLTASAASIQLDADGTGSTLVTLPAPTAAGVVDISLRYSDPSTGRFGPTSSVSVSFDPNA
ncbi:hypothetical protein V3W46_03020, partial [Subtercola sp. YIM 133946]